MSFAALAWAGKCKPGSASRKLVLMALADRHNEEAGGSYPSIAWLVEFTDLNRKTVILALSELERGGFISDSGERRGATSQVKVYRLHLESVPETEQSQKRNSSENGFERSQKRDTEPVRTSSSPKATPSPKKKRAAPSFDLPSDIPADEWRDYEEMRRSIRKPMTDAIREKAVTRLRKLRDEDGWPPGIVLSHSTLNSYQGLFPPKDRYDDRRPRLDSPDGRPMGATESAARSAAAILGIGDSGSGGQAGPARPQLGFRGADQVPRPHGALRNVG